MGCYINETEGTIEAALTFSRAELQYDIENYAFIEGDAMGAGIEMEEAHQKHLLQDIGQKGNNDRVSRVLDCEVARVREMLYPYTKYSIENPELTNKLTEPDNYGILLKLPLEFSQTSLNLLEKMVHEYLVCKVIEDWMMIVYPAKAQAWGMRAEAAAQQMRVTMNTRNGRVRRRLGPW